MRSPSRGFGLAGYPRLSQPDAFGPGARHRPCNRLPANELLAHHVVLGSDVDGGPHSDNRRGMCVDHADRAGGTKTPPKKHPASIQERLPGCLADYFVAVLETSIEAIVPALTPSVKCWRDDNSDFGHPARTLRDDDFDRA